jgi:hypothetical protein
VVEVVEEAEEAVFHLGEGEVVTQAVEVEEGSFVQNVVGDLQINSQGELQEKEEEEHHKHLPGDSVGPAEQLQVKLDPWVRKEGVQVQPMVYSTKHGLHVYKGWL